MSERKTNLENIYILTDVDKYLHLTVNLLMTTFTFVLIQFS